MLYPIGLAAGGSLRLDSQLYSRSLMSNRKRKPRIGITLGDVSGIGPEVAFKACVNPRVEQICTPILMGEASTVSHYISRLVPEIRFRILEEPEQASSEIQQIQMLDLKNIRFSQVKLGKINTECGKA